MLLEDKTAIIYGGGGVARTFAREGAAVLLAGRTREPMEAVAADIGWPRSPTWPRSWPRTGPPAWPPPWPT
jgi:NAD(P)-dependent dehydrogenase (short-subunit alcohol dehydrogenase family)